MSQIMVVVFSLLWFSY